MKTLYFESNPKGIKDPSFIPFENSFDEEIYIFLYNSITSDEIYRPYLDSDCFYDGSYSLDLETLYKETDLSIKPPSPKATNKERLWKKLLLKDFLNRFPVFLGLISNNIADANTAIANAEILYGENVNGKNFITIKSIIDKISRAAWTREKDISERQSGVSTLGTISETLLKIIFADLVDSKTFFKVNLSDVESYGDFVIMCLPNNLWISVKSNFARERLLASGYANDILGAGFFQDANEFTSEVRIRNFQRAGFLAMYCPDTAVTNEQLENDTSTYQEVFDYYLNNSLEPPTNINGKPFIRKLSKLHDDISVIINQKDIRKRTTVSF